MAEADELKREIERRREDIERDVEELSERVRPSALANQGRAAIRNRVDDVKERVMGSADEVTDRAGDAARERIEEGRERIDERREQARRTYEGNPLAVGLVAFGAGLVAASVIPPSSAERRVAEQAEPALRDAAHRATETGKEMVADLRDPAMDSAREVANTAMGAGQHVRSGS